MKYAAIIIPTLNRKKHLERCVESLKRNALAKFTDIYISVDYPPNEKYEQGYEEVKEYVKSISGFANVYIFYQEYNLGPGLNYKFLMNQIEKEHDKFIFSEDDNEFSENFLEYMNWGLEKYKDDETVYAICSCSDFHNVQSKEAADYFVAQSYNPYGVGRWIHKTKKCREFLQQKNLNKKIYSSIKMQKYLAKQFPRVYMYVAHDSVRRISVMRGRTDNPTMIDIWENVYIIVNNLYCIKPTLAKSRNWGWDGSGVHTDENQNANYTPDTKLDENTSWAAEPQRASAAVEEENFQIHTAKFEISKAEKRESDSLYLINYIFGNKLFYAAYKVQRILRGKSIKKSDEVLYD